MIKKLTACLMFKDSATYLEEWLRFHLLVGFDHFYLYDNDSTDDYLPVLEPFVKTAQVTLQVWPGTAQMKQILAHCLETHRAEGHWMAFLDDDEFIFPAGEDSLRETLKRYEQYAGVAAPWLLFGSSGHDARPPGLVTENYTRRAANPNPHVKCIVNTTKALRPLVLGHQFECVPGEFVVDEHFRPMTSYFAPAPSSDVICLNHYITRSREEMRRRRSRLPACTAQTIYTVDQYADFEATLDEVTDTRIQRFVERLGGSAR